MGDLNIELTYLRFNLFFKQNTPELVEMFKAMETNNEEKELDDRLQSVIGTKHYKLDGIIIRDVYETKIEILVTISDMHNYAPLLINRLCKAAHSGEVHMVINNMHTMVHHHEIMEMLEGRSDEEEIFIYAYLRNMSGKKLSVRDDASEVFNINGKSIMWNKIRNMICSFEALTKFCIEHKMSNFLYTNLPTFPESRVNDYPVFPGFGIDEYFLGLPIVSRYAIYYEYTSVRANTIAHRENKDLPFGKAYKLAINETNKNIDKYYYEQYKAIFLHILENNMKIKTDNIQNLPVSYFMDAVSEFELLRYMHLIKYDIKDNKYYIRDEYEDEDDGVEWYDLEEEIKKEAVSSDKSTVIIFLEELRKICSKDVSKQENK